MPELLLAEELHQMVVAAEADEDLRLLRDLAPPFALQDRGGGGVQGDGARKAVGAVELEAQGALHLAPRGREEVAEGRAAARALAHRSVGGSWAEDVGGAVLAEILGAEQPPQVGSATRRPRGRGAAAELDEILCQVPRSHRNAERELFDLWRRALLRKCS